MDGIQRPLTTIYLPATAALIPKQCRFCHQVMEIKQINLTEAVRQCYKCSTPFTELNSSDIEFFHRSYRDIHKNPRDWSLNVASEETELHSLQSWMDQVSLTVSKYEDSSDDDANHKKNGNIVAQESSLCPLDDFQLPDLVSELQQSANFSNTQSEWNNLAIDELDAALAKASYEKADSASLPFSLEDLFLPECLPQNLEHQLDCIPPDGSALTEENVSPIEKENIQDNMVCETNLVDPCEELRQNERNQNTYHKSPQDEIDSGTNKDTVAAEHTIQLDFSLSEELNVSRKTVCHLKDFLPGKAESLTPSVSSPEETNISTEKLISETTEKSKSDLSDVTPKNNVDVCQMSDMKSTVDEDNIICNTEEKVNGVDEICRSNSDLQEKCVDVCSKPKKDIDQNVDCVNICNTPAKDFNLNDDCIIGCKTPNNDPDGNYECGYLCNTPAKDTDLNDYNVSIFETPGEKNNGPNFCNTPEKLSAFNNDSVNISETPEKSICVNEKNTNNNEQPLENDCANAEFQTSTPQVFLKEKKYQRISSPGPSVMVSLNSQNFVMPIPTNILTVDSTGIFSAYQPETLVSQFYCDCDDEILQLSPSAQEKDDHCVDFHLPNLSVSSIMEKEDCDELIEDLSWFPSDLEKIIFSPIGTSSKGGTLKSKDRSKLEPTKLLLDTSKHNVCEPPVSTSEPTNVHDSILVTIPADHDITPEMLEPSSLDNVPIFFECLDTSVLLNNVNDVQAKDMSKGCDSELVVPVAVGDEFGTTVHCDNNNYNNQAPADAIGANTSKIVPVVVDESKTFVHHDTVKKQTPANETINVQDKAASSDLTEQFSVSYSICDTVGGFRIDVNRCEPNNLACTVVSAQPTEDVGCDKRIHVFQSEAIDPQYLEEPNVPVIEPVHHDISNELHYNDCTEGDFIERTDSLNNEASHLGNIQGALTGKTNRRSTEKGSNRRMVDQPLLCTRGVEEDDELKSFAGAKFSLLAKRKKGAKVEPDSKFVNLMQVVKKEVKMSNTPESKRKTTKTS